MLTIDRDRSYNDRIFRFVPVKEGRLQDGEGLLQGTSINVIATDRYQLIEVHPHICIILSVIINNIIVCAYGARNPSNKRNAKLLPCLFCATDE